MGRSTKAPLQYVSDTLILARATKPSWHAAHVSRSRSDDGGVGGAGAGGVGEEEGEADGLEAFAIEALENPQAFYDAVGDEAKYRKHLKLMMESCNAFLSIEKVDSHPMSEYRFY